MKLFHLIFVLFAVLMWNGCIDDSANAGCPVEPEDNFILKFRYQGNDPNELFIKKIQKVDVFVFTDDGLFVTVQSADLAALTSFTGITLNLDPGSYQIVCWGNVSDKNHITPLKRSNRLSDALLYNTAARSGIATTNGDSLYFASDNFTLSPSLKTATKAENVIERILNFRSAHITVQVYTKGLVDKNAQGELLPPIIEMTGVPGGYNFAMETAGNPISYLDTSAFQNISGEEFTAITFLTPRFTDNNAIEVIIRKGSDGSILTNINLKNFMLENNITVDNTPEAVISILVEYKEASIIISVPEWGQTPVDPEL